jgi:two-component system phosphoglycerate transport system response regulator PgtA
MAPGIASFRVPRQPQFLTRRRVLLVDEDARDLQYYGAVLQEEGYEVRACESFAQGVECLDKETYDFVVVSQGSRAFEGRFLLERVMTVDRRLPVLVLTRSVDMYCYMEAMQLGAVDYLEKPLPPAEIVRIVETHLRPRAVAA